METIEGKNYFTLYEVASKLNVSYRAAQNYVYNDRLKAIRIKRRVLIPEENLKELLTPVSYVPRVKKLK